MTKKELLQRIEALEARLRELEAKPPITVPMTTDRYPVVVPILPTWVPATPWAPWTPPYIVTCESNA